MILADRFVFLHLHKSGGTFVNECLLRFLPDARQVGYHLPRPLVPREATELPVLGFVRNPWSWYVSWYAFQSRRPHPNALFRIASDDGRRGFDGTVRCLLDLGSGAPELDAIVAALPRAYSNRGLNLPGFALAPIRGTGLGFYSYLERYLHGVPDVRTHVGRLERLRDDLLAALARVGQPVSRAMERHVAEAPPENASTHGDYTRYYDASLRDLVATRDRELVERFGYRFGDREGVVG